MVTMNNATTQTPPPPPPPTQQNILNQNNEKKISEYERCREERIKENFERMKKLGIFDLSLKLKASAKPIRKFNNNGSSSSATPQRDSPLRRHAGPVRRSSRLGNTTPVSYAELPLSKKGSFETDEELLRKGPKPEVYTEDQLKLLGCTNTSWTLFVDGYGKDGKRIYDQINGKTCHQCRQKTLGYRTQCIQCCKVQGQFCGDCLYMRYGENVLEALQNPDWVCPVCRGICNCSLCRNAKGWAPTGMMYKKVTKLGFKSVAHYLLETAIDREKEDTKVPVSAKRSLAFSSSEATSINMESAASKDNLKLSVELEFEKDKMNENPKVDIKDQGSLLPKPKDNCQHGETIDGHVDTETSEGHGETNIDGHVDTEIIEGSVKISADVVTNKEDGVQHTENEYCDSIVAKNIETIEGSVKISVDVVTNKEDCVQHTEENEHCDSIIAKNTETREDSVKISATVVTNKEDGVQPTENEHCDSIVAKNNTASKRKTPIRSEPMPDSIGARLRAAKRSADVVTNKEDSVQHCDSVAKNTTASKRKTPKSSEPMPDSIGARLRARRRIC